eukprot:8846728-Alexandrium_andersonii.AAC.1
MAKTRRVAAKATGQHATERATPCGARDTVAAPPSQSRAAAQVAEAWTGKLQAPIGTGSRV